MKNIWHYIKDNDYPNDNLDKLLLVVDKNSDTYPIPKYSYKIGFWREDANGWDSEYGFIQNQVVAWMIPPLISLENLK